MESLSFEVDGSLYSAEVVTRAVHRQSAHCGVELNRLNGVYQIRLISRSGKPADELRSRFMTDLVDERLREDVNARTSGLRDVLIEAALREARPRGR